MSIDSKKGDLTLEERIQEKEEIKRKYFEFFEGKSEEPETIKKLFKFMDEIEYSCFSDEDFMSIIIKEFPDFSSEEQKLVFECYKTIDNWSPKETLSKIWKKITNIRKYISLSIEEKLEPFLFPYLQGEDEKKTKK